MKTLGRLLLVSRPVSWPNTAYPFAAGYLLCGGGFDQILLIGTLFFLVPYNLLMYGVNDIFDFESDIKNPRKGGIEGALTTRAFHPVIISAINWSCVPFVLLLVVFGSTLSSVVLAIILFFVVAYSLKGLRFKEVPFLDSITSSLHFVGPLIFALALCGFPGSAWPYVVAFFLWGMASHAFGAVQDIIPDRKGGLSSIATVLGARTTVWFALTLYIIAALIVGLQGGWAHWLVALAGLSYATNIAPYLQIVDTSPERTHRGWQRFLWLNYATGFVITLLLIIENL